MVSQANSGLIIVLTTFWQIETNSNQYTQTVTKGVFIYLFFLLWMDLILYKTFTLMEYCPFGGVLIHWFIKEKKDFQ